MTRPVEGSPRRYRVVPSERAGYAPGRWQVQYYAPDIGRWFDHGDPRATKALARARITWAETGQTLHMTATRPHADGWFWECRCGAGELIPNPPDGARATLWDARRAGDAHLDEYRQTGDTRP
jgi:hypothetical protein